LSRPPRSPLPIDEVLPEVLAALRRSRRLVLEAPPGAGKTTRVPPALADGGLAQDRQVVVLEPRRLAARLAAARVAEERGEPLGRSIGYQVRFEDVSSPETRVHYLTEGILARRLVGDPTLAGVGVVVLDEFHERHLPADVCLAHLRALQDGPRPDLGLVVMSATLDADPVVRWLGGAARVRSAGRVFDVAIEHLPKPDERPLHVQVEAAVRKLVAEGLDGDVLVFLPGMAEIRRAAETCAGVAARQNLLVVPLHGSLPPQEQDRAVRPADRRKVILATNVAETSVTIDGVVAVVDSGLARVASFSPARGLPSLRLAKVSRASAAQRAGRAGRTRPGRALRLYTRHDHDTRPAHDVPEIRRVDLTGTVLELRAMGVGDLAAFGWFEAPEPAALAAAEALLVRLGALDRAGGITTLGRTMLRFPVHARLARLMVEAARRGAAEPAAAMAAVLEEGELRRREGARATSGTSDLLEAAELAPRELSYGARQARRRLVQLAESLAPARREAAPEERVLLEAILSAYPDRVARRRRPGAPDVLLSTGGAAVLADTSVVRDAELLVAVEIEQRDGALPLVRAASAIEADWLLDLFPERITESIEHRWDAGAARVEVVSRLSYDALALDEDRRPAPASPETSRVLLEAARAEGPAAFAGDAELERLRARIEVARAALGEAARLPAVDDAGVDGALATLCEGARSFADLRERGLAAALLASAGPAAGRLAAWVPERVTLPGGRSVRIEYERGKPPWIASALQDFFGMAQGPAVCEGRVPLVLHLLAPNRRDVQVTTDLAGFWERHYPALRKELGRRYPRHSWPEDPRAARPPAPRGRGR